MTPEQQQQIECLLGESIAWQPLAHSGTSNVLLSGNWQNRVLVLRINATADIAFGVDRNRESAWLERLSDYLWAPTILANAPDQGWCLMEHAGTPVIAANHKTELLKIVHAMQQLQSGPTLKYEQLWAAYRDRFQQLGLGAEHVDQLQEIEQQLSHEGYCLVHHDLQPSNLLIKNKQLCLIDWEYAGLGIPWLDMASLQQHWQIEWNELAQLPFALLVSRQTFKQRLKLAHQFNQLLTEAWYKARQISQAQKTPP